MYKKIILLLLIPVSLLKAQVETVSSEHPVYNFLKKLKVQGIIPGYDDVVLPLSKSNILELLDSSSKYQDILSPTDKDLINKYYSKLSDRIPPVSLIEKGVSRLFDPEEKVLYRYSDSVTIFTVNPVFDITGLYSPDLKNSAVLFNAGGKAYGSIGNWLGFSAQATNGIVSGNRLTAKLDKRVERSFSFNDTEINFFDGTEGHIRLKKGIADVQIGREKILWGTGNIDRMFISENPPLFDFIRFSLSYKAVKYDFMHGWLVQKPELVFIDSLIRDVKVKSSKYIALNRLGINFSEYFNMGITQAVIYSGRPAEASYLNPFILWESSQRSLNDLDNTFLALDTRWKIFRGMELSLSYLFDDIHFGRLFEKGWNTVENKTAFQAGLFYVPEIIPDFTIEAECSVIRPYTFSHVGVKEALTYTSNGYFLGIPVHPNSVKYSSRFRYTFSPYLNIMLNAAYIIHGKNLYSDNGVLIKNYGGNIYEHLTLYDSYMVYILDGVTEREYHTGFRINWEPLRDYYMIFEYFYDQISTSMVKNHNSYFSMQVKMYFE